jgi:hypothetical protein
MEFQASKGKETSARAQTEGLRPAAFADATAKGLFWDYPFPAQIIEALGFLPSAFFRITCHNPVGIAHQRWDRYSRF